jgi:PDZ domain-containing protein
VDPDAYARSQREVFHESQLLAAAAAARARGLPVTVIGDGARVVDVIRGSPADEALEAGDVIVAIDGQPVTQAAAVAEIVRSRPAGTELRVTVERDGRRLMRTVRSRRLPRLSGGVGIGIAVESRALKVDLPFAVRFRDRTDVGGPSAGLAYALAVADLLSPEDYARGRKVAATGTIDADGEVGPVGGVKEKAVAVRRARANLFVVPAGEVDEARHQGLAVSGVERLEQALASLSAVA